MEWNIEGLPQDHVWCVLHVVEKKNAFRWCSPVVGMWDGKEWMIRQYAPDMHGGSFINTPAENNLRVLAWCVISSPKIGDVAIT